MFGVILTGPRQIDVRDDLPVPEIKDGQILVHPKVYTICGSDRPFWFGMPGRTEYPYPMGFPWHETIGIVTQSKSTHFSEGDEVLAIPSGQHGYLDQFIAAETNAAVLPTGDERLVIAQPLGTVLNGAKKLSNVEGKTVGIVGQGGIGLLWTQLMRVRGAERIIVSDPIQNRLDVAAQVGATDTINAAECDTVERVAELTDGRLCDVVVEAVGEPETQRQCVRIARTRGELLFFGVPHESEFVFPFAEMYRKQLRVTSTGSTQAWDDFPVAFDLILSGQVNVDPLITHRFPHTELAQAMDTAMDGNKDGAIKVLLEWD